MLKTLKNTVAVMILSRCRYRYSVTVTHRRPPLLAITDRSPPLPNVTERYRPLLTITESYRYLRYQRYVNFFKYLFKGPLLGSVTLVTRVTQVTVKFGNGQ